MFLRYEITVYFEINFIIFHKFSFLSLFLVFIFHLLVIFICLSKLKTDIYLRFFFFLIHFVLCIVSFYFLFGFKYFLVFAFHLLSPEEALFKFMNKWNHFWNERNKFATSNENLKWNPFGSNYNCLP